LRYTAVVRRTIRFVLAVAPLLSIVGFVRDGHVPLVFRAAVAAVALLAAARPRDALLLVAAVGPFSSLWLTTPASTSIRGETLVVAFLAGWLVSAPPQTSGIGRVTRASWWWFGIVFFLIAMAALEEQRAGLAASVVQARHLIEGVALLVAVLELASVKSAFAFSLMRVLAISGAAMAMLSVRVAPMADPAATGSYGALVLGVSCGMAASARGRHRWGWLAAIVVIVVGLTFTGSRTAFVGLGLGGAVAVAAQRDRPRNYVNAGLLAGVLAFLITGAAGHPLLVHDSAFPFWIVLGLAALTSSAGTPPRSGRPG
jgi:hypothetical protein